MQAWGIIGQAMMSVIFGALSKLTAIDFNSICKIIFLGTIENIICLKSFSKYLFQFF